MGHTTSRYINLTSINYRVILGGQGQEPVVKNVSEQPGDDFHFREASKQLSHLFKLKKKTPLIIQAGGHISKKKNTNLTLRL